MRLFLLLLFISSHVFAQQEPCLCFITGKITDKDTKLEIAGALVMIPGQNKTTTTDSLGNYKIADLCEGKYQLIVRIIGYADIIQTLDFSHENHHSFGMTETDVHLAAVNINAKKIENLTLRESILDADDLFKTSGETFAAALSKINGVSMLQTGSSIAKPVIHGLHSNRIVLLNNGIRQEGQQWGSEHAPEIDPFMAKNIKVVKGARSVRYGSDAIGGVILAESENLKLNDTLRIELNNVLMSNGRQGVVSGILSSSFKNMSFRVQSTAKKSGDIKTPSYRLANTGFQEFNYSLEWLLGIKNLKTKIFWSQFNSKIGIFAGSHIGNTSDLALAIQREKPSEEYTPTSFSYAIDRPFQDLQHNLLKVSSNYNFKDGSSLDFIYGFQRNFRSEKDAIRGDKDNFQLFKMNTNSLELIYNHNPLFNLFTGFAGINLQNQKSISTGSLKTPIKSTVLIPNYNNSTLGVFIIERIVKQKYEFETGIRFDTRKLDAYFLNNTNKSITSSTRANNNLTASIGYNYLLNSKLRLGLNTGTAWKQQQVNELFSNGVHHGSASYEIGDSTLKVERALNNSFTLNYTNRKLTLELDTYLNYINDYTFLAPTGESILSIRGAFPVFKYSQVNTIFKGIDFSAIYILSKALMLETQLSILIAEDISNTQPLIFMPGNKLTNSISIQFNKTLIDKLSFTHSYNAKQNRVPTQVFPIIEGSNSNTLPLIGGDYLAPPAAYNLFDVSMLKEINKKVKAKFYIEVKNVFNTSYRNYLNKFRYYTDDIGRNIIVRTQLNF